MRERDRGRSEVREEEEGKEERWRKREERELKRGEREKQTD